MAILQFGTFSVSSLQRAGVYVDVDALDQLSAWSRANLNEAETLMETVVGIGTLTAAVGGLGAASWLYAPVFKLLGGLGTAATGGKGLLGAVENGAGVAARWGMRGLEAVPGIIVPGLGIGNASIESGDAEEAKLRMLGVGRPSAVPTGTSGAAGSPVHVVIDNHGQVGRSVVNGLTSGASRAPVGSSGPNISSTPTYSGTVTN